MQIIILFALVAAATAAAVNEPIPILSQDTDVGFDGTYKYSYQTGNGISVQEEGALKQVDKEEAEQVAGAFQYTAPDGQVFSLSYTANEDGFQPQGSHLPVPPVDDNTPPPIPAAILRALAWNAAHPEQEAPSPKKF